MALAYGRPLSDDAAHYLHRVNLAERFGWTLDYIDSLDYWDLRRTILILDAKDRARKRPKG